MVHGMVRRGLGLAPLLIAALWLWGGGDAALSGAVGLVLALLNLWLAGRIIGGVADNNPQLLLAAAMSAFAVGLAGLTVLALWLQSLEVVIFPVTGFTLVGAHVVLVLWEGARAHPIAEAAPRDGVLKVEADR